MGDMANGNSWVAFANLSGRERIALAVLPVLGLVIGLTMALVFPWVHGQAISCPPFASSCFLGPNLAGQRALWSALGMGAGAVAALGASAQLRRGRPPSPSSRGS